MVEGSKVKEPEKLCKRNGKVVIHGFAKDNEDFAKQVFEIEQYLNNQVAVNIFQKSKLAIRFHL